MKLRNSIAGALVAAAALVPPLAPAPAQAQTRTFTDTGETPGGYDGIARVKVTYGPRALSIRIVTGQDGFTDHFHVYLDTAGHGYPEWFVGIYAEVERWGMAHANKWASDESGGPLGRPGCGGAAHYAFSATPQTVSISIPNRCIGRPPRVRVNVESVFETGTVFDRLPTRYHWTPWVRRG